MIRHLVWLWKRRKAAQQITLSFECWCAKHAWHPGCRWRERGSRARWNKATLIPDETQTIDYLRENLAEIIEALARPRPVAEPSGRLRGRAQ